ncbi:DUF960 family protein [Paenibacillus donghaensis]|uniref:Uncharacterized protein n=1 Tax=Paenibacillus donghaensis TaxID=414771 RepID=A0A2Z2KFJ3_9BACL|nr:DUF960 family protein [Paenibacillus donghaensis]ASA24914.1 hypothetical protein B9T62_31670 [Paenibacillus donghaensis]
MCYTFDSQRYVTRGVNNELNPELQLLLWALLDEQIQSNVQMDYLQVFDLTTENEGSHMVQKIIHSQEQPKRIKSISYSGVNTPLHGITVWIIDSDEYVTMLLPHQNIERVGQRNPRVINLIIVALQITIEIIKSSRNH